MPFFIKRKQAIFHDAVLLQTDEQLGRINAELDCRILNSGDSKMSLSVIQENYPIGPCQTGRFWSASSSDFPLFCNNLARCFNATTFIAGERYAFFCFCKFMAAALYR